ncbi:DegT/DnrJ/EryC1/StrS family aminotransferase [Sphaerisporangium sp. NPDC051017]|uniref:DegT/DnrJ/EryC1/StrS family aminotransferase n=1 Tax=Sphaerisporangium sp. NPDC051017 TaxID=3154636 RepID=UPI00342CDAED
MTDPRRSEAGARPLLEQALAAMPAPLGSTPQVDALEAELKAVYGVDHAIAVSSGTAALQTALIASGARPGTEVLLPAFTVVMAVAAVTATGAHPVFVDSRLGGSGGKNSGFVLDLDDAAAKFSGRTVALLPVHFGGRTGDLDALREFTHDRRIKLLEDACQAQGSRWRGRAVGTIGDAGCFSMKDGKFVICGEGGYVLTDDPDIAATSAAFRSHWQTGTSTHPAGHHLGLNLRLAEPLAALARHSLADLDAALRQRRDQTRLLTTLVGNLPGLEPIQAGPGEEPNEYAALWRIGVPRPRELCERLSEYGVVNSVGTFGLRAASAHPACRTLDPVPCPNAEQAVDELLSVPLTSALDDEHIDRLAATIRTQVKAWR